MAKDPVQGDAGAPSLAGAGGQPSGGRLRKREARRKTVAYSVPIKVRAAYLAGAGRSAGQICAELGVSEQHKLRGMLRTIGVSLRSECSLAVPLSREMLATLGAEADRAGMPPEEFAARVLAVMVIEEPTVLRNLLDA